MKTLKTVSLALASAGIAFAAPVAAQDRMQDEDDILVQPTSEEARYVAQVSRQLDSNLARYSFPRRSQQSGIVRVQFTANEAGEADNLTLIGNSGSHQLDRAALWAIGRLSDISPEEAGYSSGQTIQANIIFADSFSQFARLSRRLEREESARMAMARERGERPVLALTLGGGTARAR